MRRHPALAPLSRDHHGALVEAREARRAAAADEPGRLEAGRRFGAFFAGRAVPHFRAEEEDVFPLLAPGGAGEAPEPLVRALVEHVRLHALATAQSATRSPRARFRASCWRPPASCSRLTCGTRSGCCSPSSRSR